MSASRVYGYARVSKDDEGERDSIDTQIELIKSYCSDRLIKLNHIYSDNNISGLVFERPEFQELRALILNNEVDILIAKDLSRLGRDSARVFDFLDLIQEKGIRLILIGDNHDGIIESSNSQRDFMDIKTVFNQMYSRDISRKVTSNMHQKMKRPEGLVMNATYGYIKDPANKNHFLIDEEAAEVIRLIFSLYLEDRGATNICKILNKQKIATPSVHRERIGLSGNNKKWETGHLWYSSTITKILTNDVYIGTLRCGKTKKTRLNGPSIRADESEHIVHLNHHEAIVSDDIFMRAQEIRANRKNNSVRGTNQKIRRYAGLLRCAECGKGFVAKTWITKSKGKRIKYRCALYHKHTLCSPHSIMEDELDGIIYSELWRQLESSREVLSQINEEMNPVQADKLNREIASYSLELSKKKNEIKHYAKQLAKDLIDEEIFEELSTEAKERVLYLKSKIENLKTELQEASAHRLQVIKLIDILEDLIKKQCLSNSELSLLIDRINISEEVVANEKMVDIEIVWKNIV